ncbi:MAG TPA: M15 family metallopeptidase, partial [Pseudobdellovibrionaceae bacterium]|nr:M15 family metallopeptidase [Pseudobdellovibrionaceae bacterium]
MHPALVSREDRHAIQESLKRVALDSRFVDLSKDPDFVLDIRYASENNFMGKNVYGNEAFCYLHQEAAKMLKDAASRLSLLRRGTKFLLFDGL